MNEIKLLTAGISLSWAGVLFVLIAPVLAVWFGIEVKRAVTHNRRRIAARNRAMIETVNRQPRLPSPRISLTGSHKALPVPVDKRRGQRNIHVRTRVRWIREWQRYQRFSTVEMEEREERNG